MSPQDKKKLAIGIGLLVVAGLIVYFTVFRGSRDADTTATTATATATDTASSTTSGAPPATVPTVPAARTAGATLPMGARGGTLVSAVPETSGGAPLSPPPGVQGPPFKPRPDPFAHFRVREEDMPPPPEPPPAIQAWLLPRVSHKIHYVADVPEDGFEARPEAASGQRMAGVLFNGQVYAILERDRASYVVKPGDSVGEARVHAIGRTEMVVADASGKQDVELRGMALPASAVQTGATAATAAQYRQPSLPAWQQSYGQQPSDTRVSQPRLRIRSGRGRDRDEEE